MWRSWAKYWWYIRADVTPLIQQTSQGSQVGCLRCQGRIRGSLLWIICGKRKWNNSARQWRCRPTGPWPLMFNSYLVRWWAEIQKPKIGNGLMLATSYNYKGTYSSERKVDSCQITIQILMARIKQTEVETNPSVVDRVYNSLSKLDWGALHKTCIAYLIAD
jgi:hypothetical protein